MNLSKITAELYENKDLISVYGNFYKNKQAMGLPEYMANQFTLTELVAYALAHGIWRDLGESNGYIVREVVLGGGRVLVAYSDTEIRFILGV